MPELVDCNGRNVSVPDNPERIISFSPAITETLFELGLGDNIVGVSAFCSRPKETSKIRKVGSYGSARKELIEELKPDLILTISGFQNAFANEISGSFPVYTFELPSSVAGIVDMISRVGIVTGRVQESKYLEFELLKYLGALRRRPRISGYLEIDLGGPTAFGSLSYITDALSILGIQSIYGDRMKEWLAPDFEFVKQANPDIIFYEPKMYSSFSEKEKEKLISSRHWNELDAVKNGAFHQTPGPLDFFAHHGPSFIREVLPWVVEKVEKL